MEERTRQTLPNLCSGDIATESESRCCFPNQDENYLIQV